MINIVQITYKDIMRTPSLLNCQDDRHNFNNLNKVNVFCFDLAVERLSF
jgi:hypothetical protein